MENKKQFIKGILAGFLLTVLLGGVAFGGYRMLTQASDEKKAESGELNLTGTEVQGKLAEIQTSHRAVLSGRGGCGAGGELSV